MDENNGLFADDGKSAVIPDIESAQSESNNEIHNIHNQNKGTNLISSGVVDALKGEFVKSILIPEDFDLTQPNYILDFRKVEKLRKHQIQALASILVDDGDTAIYVYLKNGLEKLGMGLSYRLDRVLLAGVKSIFGEECLVYQDVDKDKPLRELKQHSIKDIRLRI